MLDGPRSGQVEYLFRAARAAARRQHINAALRRLALLLPLPLVYGAIALGVVKWSTPSAGVASALGYGFWAMCLVPVAGAASSWLARGSRQLGALALDRHHQSADRITSALQFAELTPEQRSPWMEAAIADALRAVEAPSAARAVPLRLPRASWVSAGLALLVVLIGRLPQRVEPAPAPLPAPHPIDAVQVSEDDLALLRESALALDSGRNNPELSAAVARFNQLVEQLAEQQLDRRQLFQRLADIERSLGSPSEADAALDAGLRDIAGELEKSPLSRPVAEALKQSRLPDAEQALRELAKRLTDKEKCRPPSSNACARRSMRPPRSRRGASSAWRRPGRSSKASSAGCCKRRKRGARPLLPRPRLPKSNGANSSVWSGSARPPSRLRNSSASSTRIWPRPRRS